MLFNMLWTSSLETLYMVFFSTAFALLLGFPFGILLVITKENGLWEHLKFHQVLETSINILRSFPFIILMIVLFPLSRVITGTTIGSTAAIVPLAIGTAPFVARMIEGALLEVDSGLIEASECFAAGADIFALMGISFSVHWLGTLLTGIVISRGSNYASDLIKRLQNPDIGEIVLEDIVEAADPANKAAVHISGVPPNA